MGALSVPDEQFTALRAPAQRELRAPGGQGDHSGTKDDGCSKKAPRFFPGLDFYFYFLLKKN